MPHKFIKLFEDYTRDLKTAGAETSHTWTDVRDAIQLKRPFVIIVFRTVDSYSTALDSYFNETDYIQQTAIMRHNGKSLKYPSIFFILDSDRDFRTEIKRLYEKFDIKQIILGKGGSEYSTLYSQDGTSSDFGNEIVSSLTPGDFSTEDYFKLGSHYYRFIEFVS